MCWLLTARPWSVLTILTTLYSATAGGEAAVTVLAPDPPVDGAVGLDMATLSLDDSPHGRQTAGGVLGKRGASTHHLDYSVHEYLLVRQNTTKARKGIKTLLVPEFGGALAVELVPVGF